MKEAKTILLIGASRGLGLAMAAELAQRGWNVVGTVRSEDRGELHALADRVEGRSGRVSVETRVDVTKPDEIKALRARLDGQRFDALFVNAGITNKHPDETIGEVSLEEFVEVMGTNALAPMRVIETLQDLVAPDGLIGVMSSGQASIANNEQGGRELYRGSKAALNQLMRSYAARHAARHPEEPRAFVLMAPGWIRTELGGPDATFTLEETVPKIVDTLVAKKSRPGLEFLDRFGKTVPW